MNKLRVVIAGGGVAALECALALEALAADRVSITLVAPEPDFVYRPLAVAEPFGLGTATSVPLAEFAGDVGAEHRCDALASVTPEARTVELVGGDALTYDALVVATGARRVPAFAHGVSFRGREDTEAVAEVVQEVEAGRVLRVAFIVPPATSWSLPLYELALMSARRARPDAAMTLVTAEERPLRIFGNRASASVAALLAQAGVLLELSAHAEVTAHNVVRLRPRGRTLECDRIVALPLIAARGLPGVPATADGFVPVDPHCRVLGVDDLYAAGDATSFPVKQGGIACEQADAAAEAIAQQAGAAVEPVPFRPVLRGQLLTGERRRFLRTDLSGRSGDVSHFSDDFLWWPPSKVAGVYLAPYLAGRAAHRHPGETIGVARSPLVMLGPDSGPEFEILDFRR